MNDVAGMVLVFGPIVVLLAHCAVVFGADIVDALMEVQTTWIENAARHKARRDAARGGR